MEERMGNAFVLVTVVNAGDRERVHPGFRRRIVGVCLEGKRLGVTKPEEVKISFSRDETVRSGPVLVQVILPDSFKSPTNEPGDKWPPKDPIGQFIKDLGVILGGFYFENGYGQRLVKVDVLRAMPKPLSFESPEEMIRQLRPGVDGVILCVGKREVVFPPHAWNGLGVPEVFMSTLSADAGLSPQAWKNPGARVATFEVRATFTTR